DGRPRQLRSVHVDQSEADRTANAQRTTLISTIGLRNAGPSGEAVSNVAIEKLAYSLSEAAASAGISRSLMWELLRSDAAASLEDRPRKRAGGGAHSG